jgi:hypothetical protein
MVLGQIIVCYMAIEPSLCAFTKVFACKHGTSSVVIARRPDTVVPCVTSVNIHFPVWTTK